jgi:RNA polymerase sigma-70 factor (ECF subfamily)
MTARSDLKRLDDAALLARAREDPNAFGEFFERHYSETVAYLYRRTGCAEIAADLAAETFAAAFLASKRFEDTGTPATVWLLAIARRKLADSLRRGYAESRARSKLGMQTIPVDQRAADEIQALVDLGEVRQRIREAMGELTPQLAQAVYLRIGLDLPYLEVGRRLRCSEGAARVRVMRGLSKLSNAMGVN